MLPTRPQRRRKRSLTPPRARRPEELFLRGSYTPFGKVTTDGDVEQPIQRSSEYYDPELALVYYKPADGCKAGWTCAKHAPRRGEIRNFVLLERTFRKKDGMHCIFV